MTHATRKDETMHEHVLPSDMGYSTGSTGLAVVPSVQYAWKNAWRIIGHDGMTLVTGGVCHDGYETRESARHAMYNHPHLVTDHEEHHTMISIAYAVVEDAWGRVHTEDGAHDQVTGKILIARSEPDRDGVVTVYGYRKTDDESIDLPYSFHVCDEVPHNMAEALNERLSIDAQYWCILEMVDTRALPDYATNPERPEYN